jgi:hypothetical protein
MGVESQLPERLFSGLLKIDLALTLIRFPRRDDADVNNQAPRRAQKSLCQLPSSSNLARCLASGPILEQHGTQSEQPSTKKNSGLPAPLRSPRLAVIW